MSSFRNHLFPTDDPRVADLRLLGVREYAVAARSDPFAGPMIEGWRKLYPQPFRGVTSDGVLRDDVFSFDPVDPINAAPARSMTAAARRLLSVLDKEQSAALLLDIEAHEWRSWSNPEFLQHDTGLRLDEVGETVRGAFLALVESSLSPTGYELVRDCMRINGFLGDVVGLPVLMNEYSYNVAVYGEPSETQPWGWQLFGHHVALNCLVAGDRMVLSPVFLGAEPDIIDEGPFAGTRVFGRRIEYARALMGALTPAQRDEAIVYEAMVDESMPPGRIHSGDERHLAGAFQDNRIIPYEGVRADTLDQRARALLEAIVAEFLELLPEGPARVRSAEIAAAADETWFSWIGGWEGEEPFYFRIQSPVAILELDHHSGVFLANREPASFHMHTVMRTPNGNDYGRLLAGAVLGRPLAP